MSDNEILRSLQTELGIANMAYLLKPDYNLLQEIRFLEHKVRQYKARAAGNHLGDAYPACQFERLPNEGLL